MMPSPEVLPCGCVLKYSIENGLNVMTVSPCHPDCRYLGMIIEEANQCGKPIERKEAP
jgi:hypothetical protein